MNYIGIDLGTTFSSLACLNAMGEPVIVADMKTGEHSLPSAVSWTKDGHCLVGRAALHNRYFDLARSVRWIKRQMGERNFIVRIDDKIYKPSDISAIILQALKESAEKQIGALDQVIITVPANFGDIARSATIKAAKKAGLNVIGLLDEPVAAAYYLMLKTDIQGKVLVFDLGGGTLDVSLVEMTKNNNVRKLRPIASQGDRFLGGCNFDQKLTDYFNDLYMNNKGVALFMNDEERARIIDYAEEIKCGLGNREKIQFHLDGERGRYNGDLSSQVFENLIKNDLAGVEMLVEGVVRHEAKMNFSDIDCIALVGGSSRLECIKKRLWNLFGKNPVTLGNLDEVVALGAALYAKNILSNEGDIKIHNVCNHGYGLIYKIKNPETDQYEERNKVLIPKMTKIPYEREIITSSECNNQKQLIYKITQGESTDKDMVSIISTVSLPLPNGLPAKTPIQVKFKYDINQCMHCSFKILNTGDNKEIDIDMNDLD